MSSSSTNVQTITDALVALCGADFVDVRDEGTSVAPANTEEVAAALRAANQSGFAVTPLGSGTKQGWGTPARPVLKLLTHRLNRVLEHTWQDMTCVVEAGCTWASLEASLAQHGQFVALDPLWPEKATVGGIAATNDSGSLRQRYGSLRDLIIGMTIVLPDGTIARTGGKVVKNVAGYDLHKLMTGAMGTLGVITDVAFRLHSIPRNTRCLSVLSSAAEPLGALLLQILDSHMSTQALQLRGGSDGFHLDVELVAMPEVLHDQGNALTAAAQKLGLVTSETSAQIWQTRQQLFERTNAVLIKATMLPTKIAGLSAAVTAAGGTCVTQAVGVMTASIPVSAAAEIVRLRKLVEDSRGSLTILQQPADAALDPWGTPPDTLALMRVVKQRFDPQHILNPGRYFGGI
jgi:glycolate oxidase FAD binding subunit